MKQAVKLKQLKHMADWYMDHNSRGRGHPLPEFPREPNKLRCVLRFLTIFIDVTSRTNPRVYFFVDCHTYAWKFKKIKPNEFHIRYIFKMNYEVWLQYVFFQRNRPLSYILIWCIFWHNRLSKVRLFVLFVSAYCWSFLFCIRWSHSHKVIT